jgi:hypothetical protein
MRSGDVLTAMQERREFGGMAFVGNEREGLVRRGNSVRCPTLSGAIGVGVGVGANLLFGGTGRSIALQPLSVEGSVGVNLSLGVSKLTLALAQ